MRKATVNYWIDVVIAVGFLVSAVTGILFLLPSVRSVSADGAVTILGVSVLTLHKIHDWSGVIATVGVLVHVALHWRWLVSMTRRLAADDGRAARRRVEHSPAAAQPARVAAPMAAATVPETVVAGSASDDDRRLSRRAFVLGLGTAVGTAAVLGFGALLRSDATSAGVQLADAQSGNGWQGDGSTPSDGGGSTGSTDGSVQRVVVDSSACSGCGRCLDVCPYGVFAWSGATVVAQSPDACRLCGHCVRVCPAGSITLNG